MRQAGKREIMWASFSCAMRGAQTGALVLLAVSVSFAYTIVFRDKHRQTIPDNFTVNELTLTYQTAPGFSVSLQLQNIDIAATERANYETSGSFLRHRAATFLPETTNDFPFSSSSDAAENNPRAARTVTNRELSGIRERRLQAEREAAARRAAQGLPPLEETNAATNVPQANDSYVQTLSAARQQNESYWRARAAELHEQINVIEAQMSYLQNQLNALDESARRGITVTTIVPYGYAPYGYYGGFNFGFGATVARGGAIELGASRNYNRRSIIGARPNIITPNVVTPYGYFPSYNYAANDGTRDTLQQQLQQLRLIYSGLDARWATLQDEARRAGALPGWLRP